MFGAYRRRKFFSSIEWTLGRVAAMPLTPGSCNQTTIRDSLNNTLFWGRPENHSTSKKWRTSNEGEIDVSDTFQNQDKCAKRRHLIIGFAFFAMVRTMDGQE